MLSVLFALALQLPRAEALLPVEQYRLPNGLTVVFALGTTTPYVAVETWYPAGTRDDPPTKRGLSHLFEHSFGARRVYTNPANAPLRNRIVNSNAQTRRDYTRYYVEVRAQDVVFALALHADRMDTPDSMLTDSVVARNVDVVVNEGRQGRVNSLEDGPGSFFLLGQHAFVPNHPYANGNESEQTLRAITAQDLRNWRRAHYGPERAILLLVGNFDSAKARVEISRLFATIPPGGAVEPVRYRGLALPTPQRREQITGRVVQSTLWRRWSTPWYGDADGDLLQLAALILARPHVGPIAQPLIRDGHLAAGPTSQWQLSELAGDVHVQLSVRDNGGLDAAEMAIDAAVTQLAVEGPKENDVAWAKREWELVLLAQLEPLGFQNSRAEVLGEGVLFGADAERYRERLERVRRATSAAIASAARRWMLGAGYTLELVPRLALTTQSAAPVDRSATVTVEPAASARLAAIERVELASGPHLIVAPRPASPLVRLSLLLPAAHADRSASMNDLVARVLARELERSAVGRVERAATADEGVVSLTIRPADLDRALGVVASLATAVIDPAWQIDRDVVRPRAVPSDNDIARRIALGASHRAVVQDSQAAFARLQALDDASVTRYIRERLTRAGGGATLLLSGKVTRQQVATAAGRLFANWPAVGSAPSAGSVAAAPAARGIYVRSVPGRGQMRVAAIIPLPAETSPGVEALLESDLHGRVNTRLRVERQWSYGAASATVGLSGNRILIVSADVQNDRGGDAVAEIERVLAEYRAETAARQASTLGDALRQGIARRAQTLSGLEALAREALVADGDASRVAVRFERIGTLGEIDIAAARTAANPTRLRFLVTGDAQLLADQLSRLGRPAAALLVP